MSLITRRKIKKEYLTIIDNLADYDLFAILSNEQLLIKRKLKIKEFRPSQNGDNAYWSTAY